MSAGPGGSAEGSCNTCCTTYSHAERERSVAFPRQVVLISTSAGMIPAAQLRLGPADKSPVLPFGLSFGGVGGLGDTSQAGHTLI